VKKLVISVTLLIALTACSNTKLVEQAETHYANAEYTSALEAYSKALDKKEDGETRNAYTSLKSEIDRIHTVNKLRHELKLAINNHESTVGIEDLKVMTDNLLNVTAEIDAFDTSIKDDVSDYVNKLRESNDYTSLKFEISTIQLSAGITVVDTPWITDAKRLSERVNAVLAKPELPYGYADVN